MKVYMLEHLANDSELAKDFRIIGFYSSISRAEAAQKAYSNKPGFCEFPDGFNIDFYDTNQKIGGWDEGFFRY